MTTDTNNEVLLKAAAARLLTINPELGPDAAIALATAALSVDTPPAPTATPVAPPSVPKLDVAALTGLSDLERSKAWIAQEQALAKWIPTTRSYSEPMAPAAVTARQRLDELKTQPEATTDAERCARAYEREQLTLTILSGGNSEGAIKS